MDSPVLNLPPAFDDDTIQSFLISLGLPTAQKISYYNGQAAYHSIYLVNFSEIHKHPLEPAYAREADG